MELFKSINWTIVPPPGPFLSDEYLMDHSRTYKLLTNRLQGMVVHKGNGDKGNRHLNSDEVGNLNWEQEGERTSDLDNDDAEDTEGKPQQFKYVAGLRKFLPYPKTSSLSAKDQKLYIKLRAQFSTKCLTVTTVFTPEVKKEFDMYQTLHARVLAEQIEFNAFLREHWTTYVTKYYTLSADITRYTSEAWEHRLKRVDRYNRYYSKVKTLPLTLQGDGGGVTLIPGEILLQLGRIPYVIRPKFSNRVQMLQDYNRVIARVPTDTSLPAEASRNCLHKQPVSEDPNARLLAETYDVDIVISSGGLQRLAANLPPYDRPWDVPLVVREHVTAAGGRRTVTYVDKPLPPRDATVADRNKAHHKVAAKLLICFPRHNHSYRFPYSNEPDKSADLPQETSIATSVPDTSSVTATRVSPTSEAALYNEQLTSKATRVSPTLDAASNNEQVMGDSKLTARGDDDEASNDESDWNESDDEPLMVICLASDSEDRDGNSEKVVRNTRSKSKPQRQGHAGTVNKEVRPPVLRGQKRTAESPLPAVAQEVPIDKPSFTQPTSATAMPVVTKKMFILPSEHAGFDNVSYQLWTIKREAGERDDRCFKRMKHADNASDRDIRILVRTKLDGCERSKQAVLPVCVLPKLEYQSKFGAEVMSRDELIHEWLSLTFRPGAMLYRARVHAETSEVLLVEYLRLEQVTQECQRVMGFTALPQTLATLYCLLSGLIGHPAGQYLLSHTATMEAFALLQRGDSEWANYDLKSRYTTVDPRAVPVPGVMPWRPVDTDIALPYHQLFSRVPGTFHPSFGNKPPGQARFNGRKKPPAAKQPAEDKQPTAARQTQSKATKNRNKKNKKKAKKNAAAISTSVK